MVISKQLMFASAIVVGVLGCKTATSKSSTVQDAGDVMFANLPDTVTAQWSCIVSTRIDAEVNPMPPPKPIDFPCGQVEAYLALEQDTFYFDKDAKFYNAPTTVPPETWVPQGLSGPGYTNFQIKYSLRQEMAQRGNDADAPVPSFASLRFSGLLKSGYYTGSFFAMPTADASGTTGNPVIYDCYQKKWWPLSPPGW